MIDLGDSASVFLVQFLSYLALSGPHLLVYLVGMILALVWWRRHRGVSALALTSLGLMTITTLAQGLVSAFMLSRLIDHESYIQHAKLSFLFGIVFGFLKALELGLLVFAVFAGRSGTPKLIPQALEGRLPGASAQKPMEAVMPRPPAAAPSEQIRKAEESPRA
jgi:hypothetical protein